MNLSKLFSDRRRWLLYGALPLAFGLLLVAFYFSSNELLQTLASPAMQREFGLIENLQNLILLGAIALCWRTAREVESSPAWAWRLASLFCLLLLLEEIDWGDHYWSLMTGFERPEGEHFNLHNQGDINRYLKKVVDIGFAVFFVLLPLFRERVPLWLRALTPDPHSVLTLLGGVIVSQLAHGLEDAAWPNNGSLFNNISEFRETFTYFIGLYYLSELAERQRAA